MSPGRLWIPSLLLLGLACSAAASDSESGLGSGRRLSFGASGGMSDLIVGGMDAVRVWVRVQLVDGDSGPQTRWTLSSNCHLRLNTQESQDSTQPEDSEQVPVPVL
jgi:hypothetical protein